MTRIRAVFIPLAMVATVSLAVFAFMVPVHNRIANPSFEREQGSREPVGWNLYRPHGSVEWGVVGDASVGKKCGHLRVLDYDRVNDLFHVGIVAGQSNGYVGSGTYKVKPGESYLISFRARGTLRGLDLVLIGWKTTSGALADREYLSTPIKQVALGAAWTKYQIQVDVPEGIVKMVPMFRKFGRGTDVGPGEELYLDDVVLARYPPVYQWALKAFQSYRKTMLGIRARIPGVRT